VTGGRRRSHNKKLPKLYALPNIVRMMKSKSMTWAGNVARMG